MATMAPLPAAVVQQIHLWQANYTQKFGVNGETGIDVQLPYLTPVRSLTDGVVLGDGYYGGGGVVSVRSTLNYAGLGDASVYYQHLARNVAHSGQRIRPGDLIGYSGGQIGYGEHPSSSQFSTGPHIEIGINAPFGGMWHPLGPNINPEPWLLALLARGYVVWTGEGGTTAPNTDDGTPASGSVIPAFLLDFVNSRVNHGESPGWAEVGIGINNMERLPGLPNLIQDVTDPLALAKFAFAAAEGVAVRSLFFLLGAFLLLLVILKVTSEQEQRAASTLSAVAPLAAMA